MVPAAEAQTPLFEFISPNEEQTGNFGRTAASVPDADGDGRGDLLIGALNEDPLNSPLQAGVAYLFSGATGALLHTLISPNLQAGGIFGASVSGVPDADGDGRGDLLVGAVGEEDGAGRAYLFSGATGELLHTLASPNTEVAGMFGWSVSGVPDADGDGRGDLLVGSRDEDPGASPDQAGRAYLFSGATGTLLHTLASPNEEDDGNFGYAASGVPDTDGDGRGDLLVSSRHEGPGASPDQAGRAYLFSGATGALLHTLVSPNEESGGRFGVSVADVADADGDGRGDLLVGAYFEDPGPSPAQAGRAYLFSGASGAFLYELASPNQQQDARFGIATDGVPDLDGDGRTDLVIAATHESPVGSPNRAGRVHLFSGATGAWLGTVGSPNEQDTGRFGFAVGGVDDVDDDGKGDLLIGTFTEDPDPSPAGAGRAYLFSGGSVVVSAGQETPMSGVRAAAAPNPFRARTTVRFVLDTTTEIRLSLYDLLGHEVAVLAEGTRAAGTYEVVVDGDALPSGTYFWRLTAGSAHLSGRITRLR